MGRPGFTPGPWEAGLDDDDGSFTIWAPQPGHIRGAPVICSRNQWTHKAAESHANARLIAAAPELYECVADFVSAWETGALGLWRNEDVDRFRAALSRAAPERGAR